jgi:DNA polymerase-3 subunit delta
MVKSQAAVLLFVGPEDHLKAKAIDALKASIIGKQADSLDYRLFHGSDSSIKDVLDCASTVPFSSPRRLIVMKEPEKLPKDDLSLLIAYTKKPSKFTCLVLDSPDDGLLRDGGLDSGTVSVSYFGELSDREVAKWIKDFLACRRKRMDAGAVEILRELQRNDLSRLAQELEKLTAFTGARPDITAGDVEELVGRSSIRDAFEIAKLVAAADAGGAVKMAGDLMASGKKPHEIIGLLSWHFRNMMRARILLDRGLAPYRAAAALGIGRNYMRDFLREARRADTAAIRAKLRVLLETDMDIKRTRFDPGIAIELAIIRLCLG